MRATSQTLARVLLALGLTWSVVLVALWWPYDVDDAYILLRYGRHLALGHGLSWNPGGPHVEGYTNVLYVWFGAAATRLGVDALPWLKGLGVASLASILALSHALSRSLGHSVRGTSLVVLALCSSSGLAFWSVAGLETTFVSALLLAALLWFRRDTSRGDLMSAGALLLASLARTEFPAWGVLLFLVRLTTTRAPRRLAPWLLFALPLLALTVWRVHYFGQWLPNPVLFKSTLTSGTDESVLVPFVRTWWPWLAVAGLTLARQASRLLSLVFALALFVFATATTSVHGATTMSFFDRYLLPFVPVLVLLGVDALERVWLSWPRTTTVLALALVGWTLLNPFVNPSSVGSMALSVSRNVRPATRALTQWLNERPGRHLAMGDVGYVGAHFEGELEDLYGLNDPTYTRVCQGELSCWTNALFLREPDLFVFVMKGNETAHEVEARLISHPAFADFARTREFRAGDNPWAFVVFERKAP